MNGIELSLVQLGNQVCFAACCHRHAGGIAPDLPSTTTIRCPGLQFEWLRGLGLAAHLHAVSLVFRCRGKASLVKLQNSH